MIKNRQLASAGYGTHIAPLTAAALSTKGTIIEMGAGDYSTPLLHEIAKAQNRPLITYETDKQWLINFIDLEVFKTKVSHFIEPVANWDQVEVRPCGLLFIDHAPAERRIIDIERFMRAAQVIVVHDSEKRSYYKYDQVFKYFKYKNEYQRYSKKTMLLSNYIDVTKLI